jgi:hypothetical protein
MIIPLVTNTLTQAGTHLLNVLIDRLIEYGDATDMSLYVILEHYLREASDPDRMKSAFDAAQDRFSRFAGNYAGAHERWVETFAGLLKYAGPDGQTFAEALWRAHFFQSQSAAEALWDQYPELQRVYMMETRNFIPRTWGDWIPPMEHFMATAERCLVEQIPIFREVFDSEDVQDIVEELPVAERDAGDFGVSIEFSPGGQFGQATLSAYLSACVERIGHIDRRGYPRSVHTTVPLSDVYIPLRLVPLTGYDKPQQYIRYQTSAYDDPEWHVFHDPLGYRELEDYPGEMLSDVLAHHQQVLVLGDSGTGKTMLLRYVVLEYARILLEDNIDSNGDQATAGKRVDMARPLPIYVDLASYVENRLRDETLIEFALRMAVELTQEESLRPLLEQMLANGQCLLLLDGLDQAASDEQRRMLVAEVTRASETCHGSGNQIAVTSRLAGYDVAPLPPSFAGYVIHPLERSQLLSFLLRWKLALALMHRPLMDKDEALRRIHPDMVALARQITTNSRLYVTVNTPLLLRMLVAVYQPGMMLSPQRVAVYQLVADALIREWRLAQRETNQPAVLEHEVIPLLGELAYWLQASRPTGLLTEQELRQILGRIWSRMRPGVPPEQVYEAIGNFIGILRVHSGVLIELAPQRYGFIYHGLQEYFAARYMVASYRHAASRIREHLHDPRWDEVITAAIGFKSLVSPDDASDLIEAAVLARGGQAAELFGNASSPFESLLKRDLFFAARLLGSGVEVRPEMAEEIVRTLMDLWLRGDRGDLGRFTLIFDKARRHLINLDGTMGSRLAAQIAIQNLPALTENIQAFAVDAMTFSLAHQAEAQAALAAQGKKVPALTRRATARALSRMSGLTQDAYALLLELTADPDEQVCRLSQETLRQTAPVPYEALSMWVNFLNSNDPVRQRVSLRRLQQIGTLPPVVIAELLNLLNNTDAAISQRAMETLAGVFDLPEDALTIICRSIGDADPRFKAAAIGAFARPVELPGEVITQLIRWSDDPDVRVRQAAIRALGACLNATPDVLEALIERLEDASDSIRAAVVEPLVLKGRDYPPAIHMLRHAATDPIYHVRHAVATSLRHIPQPGRELQTVLQALLSDREVIVREATLQTIGCLASPGDEIIDYLISLAGMPEHPITRTAVRAMASLRGLPDRALIALVQSLEVYRDSLGREIVACLAAHVPLSSEVIYRVMDLAVLSEMGSDQARRASASLRALGLEILGYALDAAPAVLQILMEAYTTSDNVAARAAALRAMAHARDVPLSVLSVLQGALKSGPYEIRCAAGVALGHLIRNMPAPPLMGDQLLETARDLADVLMREQPHAAWEEGAQTQNELLQALSWVVGRARPTLPRLSARSEDARGYLD